MPEKDVQVEQAARMTIRAWLTTLKVSWQTVLYFDRSSVTAFQAIRSTVGLALPLILGVVTDQIETGVLVASGCLMLGSIGLKDPYRRRARTMLLACLFVTLAALVGGVVGGFGWLPVLLAIRIAGIIAGMFASIGPAAQIIAIQACVALIVYTHLELDPPHALLIASAVGTGAVFQTLLAVIPSPWTNTVPERTALARIYRQLADYAAHPFGEQGPLQLSAALLDGHTTLLYSNSKSERGQMLARLLEEAEHLRLTLSLLARQRQRLAKKGTSTGYQQAGACVDLIVQAGANELRVIAQALTSLPAAIEISGATTSDQVKQAIAELRQLAQSVDNPQEILQLLPHCTALLGGLHIARRLATSWREARQYWPARIRFPYPRPSHLRLEDVWTNLHANLTPRSSAFRHAARLGVALMLATALYQAFHLSVERGYWIPMTAALVLRSDFTTTFTRGIARLLGTMLGAVLTTLLVIGLAPQPALLAVIVIIAGYLMFTTLFANYAIFSAATTMAVVFLLAFIHAPTLTTAADRALDTAVGGILALLVYAIWPTWEQSQVPGNIAKRLEALGHYLYAIGQEYANPETRRTQTLERRHRESRLARSNAIGSVQRSLQEPAAHRVEAELAQGLLAAADNISRCALALEAYLRDNPRIYAFPEMVAFCKAAGDALNGIASTVQTRQRAELPDMQAALQRLKAAARATKQLQGETQAQWRFVIDESRRVVAYIQVMKQLLETESFG